MTRLLARLRALLIGVGSVIDIGGLGTYHALRRSTRYVRRMRSGPS